MKLIQVAMEEDLLRRVFRKAKARQLTRAALIREACKQYLEKLREDELDREYAVGYGRHPETAAVGKVVKDSRLKYGPAGIGHEAQGH